MSIDQQRKAFSVGGGGSALNFRKTVAYSEALSGGRGVKIAAEITKGENVKRANNSLGGDARKIKIGK